jgi:phenylpyruvate tautomerase PptA (4-oxalocrotonate tautomerase family)
MSLAQITTFDGRFDVDPIGLLEAVDSALVDSLEGPPDDPTVWLSSEPTSGSMLGARFRSDAVVVQVKMFSGRSSDTIAKVHSAVSDRITGLDVEPTSVLCVIEEVPVRNWSVGGTPQDEVDVGFRIDI